MAPSLCFSKRHQHAVHKQVLTNPFSFPQLLFDELYTPVPQVTDPWPSPGPPACSWGSLCGHASLKSSAFIKPVGFTLITNSDVNAAVYPWLAWCVPLICVSGFLVAMVMRGPSCLYWLLRFMDTGSRREYRRLIAIFKGNLEVRHAELKLEWCLGLSL